MRCMIYLDHYNQHNFWGCPNGVPAVDLYDCTEPAWGKNDTYNGYEFTAKAIEYITDHTKNTPDQPFFVYFPLHNTHAPNEAPESFTKMYSFNETKRNIFDAMTSVVDQSVKNVTDALKSLNLWDNTLFIWTTDNGSPVSVAGSNYPFRGSKGIYIHCVHAVQFVNNNHSGIKVVMKTTKISRHDKCLI